MPMERRTVVNSDKALVIVPCYNERDNIGRLVERIAALHADLHVLVIDDNSPDGTGELVESLKTTYPELRAIHRPGKLGLGTAYRAGFRFALEQGYAQAITMDADFSHQPHYLPGLRDLAAEADLVVGSRYVPGGGAAGWPLRRKIVSGFANYLAHTVLSISTRDCTSGFRCYRRETLLAVDPDSVLSSGYSFLVEMLYRVEKSGLTVREIPIVFVDREAGKSKINRDEVYKTLFTLGRLRFPSLPWRYIGAVVGRVGERSALVMLASGLLLSTVWLVRRRR